MSIHFGDKNVKEIRYGEKKVKEVWYGDKKVWPSAPSINLDPNSDQPIGRMDDGELWFRVNVKDPNEPFKIAVNGWRSTNYDWDISIDGADPVRKTGSKSTTPISLPMSVGKHYVKITPHNGATAGRARCMGSDRSASSWNNDVNKLEFGLEWLPGYAFMESETRVGDYFLYYAWYGCSSLTSMPSGFNLPQGITSVGNSFLESTWDSCSSLTSIPNGFNLPQGITSVGGQFLYGTWYGCSLLTSMPSGFNIPQGITSVGDDFLRANWRNCSSLTSMPSGFNLPQGITSVGDSFLESTWDGCSSLTSDSPAEPINFPNVSGGFYANSCFGNGCPITPDTPNPGSSVMIRRSP